MRPKLLLVLVAAALAGCQAEGSGGDPAANAEATSDTQRYPDVLEVVADCDDATCAFEVTVSSPYDTAERYADGWRVMAPDGTELGVHTLGHDHANEQPFTRTQSGVDVPLDIATVVVEGRDSANGFGGETVTVTLPDR